jgi:ferredoxin-nitrite reductase
MRVAADEVPGYIANVLAAYEAESADEESFREFIAARDEDELDALADPEETDYEDPFMHNTKMTWYPYADEDDMDDRPTPARADGTPISADD